MSCPICLEAFSDPVVLPCGHSLCSGSCASRLVKRKRIKCPTCRTIHRIPEGERGLPKNYALLQMMEERPTPGTKCLHHQDETATLFCTECYEPVCVKCCLVMAPGLSEKPSHKEHQVIPLDQMQNYIKGLLSVAEGYLSSKRNDEHVYLDSLLTTDEKMQHAVNSQCQAIKQNTQILKQILDDRSKRLVGCLQTSSSSHDINKESDQSMSRLLQYTELLERCKKLEAETQFEDYQNNLSEFRHIISSLDHLPELDHHLDPTNYLNSDPQHIKFDLAGVTDALTRCYAYKAEKPHSPTILQEECVADTKSISVKWIYTTTDRVGYFTVYYETGIFTNGLCSDLTSVVVTDFSQTSGHVTLRPLEKEKRYRLHVTASNEFGESSRSDYLYFKASSSDPDIRLF